MSARECALCGHYQSEHGSRELGSRCRFKFGAWGIGFLDGGQRDWEQCLCPGFEPHADDEIEDDE